MLHDVYNFSYKRFKYNISIVKNIVDDSYEDIAWYEVGYEQKDEIVKIITSIFRCLTKNK